MNYIIVAFWLLLCCDNKQQSAHSAAYFRNQTFGTSDLVMSPFVAHLYCSSSRLFRFSGLLVGKAAQFIQTLLYFCSGFIIYCIGKHNKTRSTSQPIPLLFIAFFVIRMHIKHHSRATRAKLWSAVSSQLLMRVAWKQPRIWRLIGVCVCVWAFVQPAGGRTLSTFRIMRGRDYRITWVALVPGWDHVTGTGAWKWFVCLFLMSSLITDF